MLYGKRTEIICTYCGNKFHKLNSKLIAKSGKYFCTRKCKDTAQQIASQCDVLKPGHYGTSYFWKINDNKRNNNCCEICGESRLYILAIHHLDGNRNNNHPDNLKTLCFNCHGLHHLDLVKGKLLYKPRALSTPEILDQVLQGLGKSDNPPVLETGDPRSVTETPDHI